MNKISSVANLNFFYKLVLYVGLLILFNPKQFTVDLSSNLAFYVIVFEGIIFTGLFLKAFWKKIRTELASKILFGYVLTNILILPFSKDIGVSLLHLSLLAAFYVIYTAIGEILNTKQDRFQFSLILLLLTLLLALVSFFNTFFLKIVNMQIEGVNFMSVYFGHNHLSAILLFAIPINIWLINYFSVKSRIKTLLIAILVILVGGLFLTFSRGAVVALFLGSGIGFIKYQIIPKKIIAKLVILVVVLLLAFILIHPTYFLIFQKTKPFPRIDSRAKEWSITIQNTIKTPFTGTGLGTFYQSKEKKGQAFSTFFALNFVLNSLSDTGIISTSLFLIFLVLVLGSNRNVYLSSIKKIDGYQLALLISLVCILINNLIDFDLQLPAIGLLFWMFLGLLNSPSINDNQLEKN